MLISCPGDTITRTTEVLEVRQVEPITRPRASVARGNVTLVLEGTALCHTVLAES